MNRLIPPLIFGLAGIAVLVSLAIWQFQRLHWKNTILADIDARILAEAVAVPAQPDPVRDRYLPVVVSGRLGAPFLRVLASRKKIGAGYRLISPLQLADRIILIDRGFIKLADAVPAVTDQPVTFTGNLHWPDEVDGYTPEPDYNKNIWFARDVPAMAAALSTEPILLVARTSSIASSQLSPMPVDSKGIANNHLQYALTWISLAVIWLCMTLFYIIRTKPKTES